MKKIELTEDEIRYLISKISENRSERKIGLTKLIEKLKQSLKPSLDRNLFCIINSGEKALLANELNEFEGIDIKQRLEGPYTIDLFSHIYCYIGFHKGYWQTIKLGDITVNRKLVSFEKLKSKINDI